MSEVWPRRNLGRGEHWGRVIEKRVDGLSKIALRQDQSRDGLGRFTASTAESLLQNAETLAKAINATPRYFSEAASATGFAIGGGWLTVASISVPNPAQLERVEVTASASVYTYQTPILSNRFIWPFSLDYVTSEFGPRPPLPFHNGIDFAWSGCEGAAIPATHNGTIILRSTYSDWGNYTRIDCSAQTGHTGDWTGYAHMNAPGLYEVGTAVTQGQTIGYIGSTGLVTGPHLHYETASGSPVTRMNPRDFMDIFGGVSGSYVGVEARISINGVTSPVFQPFTEMGYSSAQVNFPVFGSSISGTPGEVQVKLDVRAPGGSVPAAPPQTAMLSIRGGFRNA